MQPIKPCNTYHAIDSGRHLLRPPDGKSAFKVYFLDIIGRKDPSRTVWAAADVQRAAYLEALAAAPAVEGIGFITAFPHVTKIFRYAPEAEIVLHVRALNSRDMTPIDLARADDYLEFACLAEAVIAADEYLFWAEAQSVAHYLKQWSPFADGPVARNDKLGTYWASA